MIKLKYILPIAAAAMTACTPDEPTPPAPPSPPVKKTRTFPTTSSVEQIGGYLDSVAQKVGNFDNYVLNIGDMPLTAHQNDQALPDAIGRAAGMSNLTLNKNGKVYTAGDANDNKIVWTIAGFKAHGMPMTVAPNGALPYAKDLTELAEFHNLGYTSMASMPAPEITIKLTAEDAEIFDDYIKKLKTEYPNGVALDLGDIIIPEISMETLAELAPDGGRVKIKDYSQFRVDIIKSTNPTWGIGPGTSHLGDFYLLSRNNGHTPRVYWYGETFNEDMAPIEISSQLIGSENKVNDYISGSPWGGNAVKGDFILLDDVVLPSSGITFVDKKGARWENRKYYGWPAGAYALLAGNISDLDKKMEQSAPLVGSGPIVNSNAARDWLRAKGVAPYGMLHFLDVYKPVNCYTSAEQAQVTMRGKAAVAPQQWVRPTKNATNSRATARMDVRNHSR